jgi:hypothetical protein
MHRVVMAASRKTPLGRFYHDGLQRSGGAGARQPPFRPLKSYRGTAPDY